MPNSGKKWPIILLLLIVPIVAGLSIANAVLYSSNSSSRNEIKLLRQREAADHRYIAAQKTAAQLAAKVAVKARQAQCRAAIGTTHLADRIILNIKASLLDVAAVSTNPKAKATLIRRARDFEVFPVPKCDTGEGS